MSTIQKKQRNLNVRELVDNPFAASRPATSVAENDASIQVTKTFLPPIEEYASYLKGIWSRKWVTNYGPLQMLLEKKLKQHLGVRHLFFVNSGTISLQVAIKALDLKGEIITTPFSYVATTSSIVWEGCTPVFADIDPQTLCLNPKLIERSITPQTQAILATHVFGNPCDVQSIGAIAKKHNLKVIYDAAHAFDVSIMGRSILDFGTVSTLSFHATKLFHTIEGGAIVTDNDELARRISYMINFGHDGPERFAGLGINCKSSEFHAAMGLCVLPKIGELIGRRRAITKLYDKGLYGLGLDRPLTGNDVTYNFAYYPVIFPSEELMLQVRDALIANRIFPRRYFYPSLNFLPYTVKQEASVSEDISARILCLPLFYELSDTMVDKITCIIRDFML
ncbi:MAG: DegT/DnrJ/EryC1/StrS family aminotransferase [Balneolales bacterium]